MTDETSNAYFLWDSKTHEQKEFASLDDVQAALRDWINRQRSAGESVVEQPTGQWSDSRVTVWIADGAGRVIPLTTKP